MLVPVSLYVPLDVTSFLCQGEIMKPVDPPQYSDAMPPDKWT